MEWLGVVRSDSISVWTETSSLCLGIPLIISFIIFKIISNDVLGNLTDTTLKFYFPYGFGRL